MQNRLPPNNFTPRPYQNLIITHIHDSPRSNIWAGMGMGKTVATLTALEDLFMCGAETQPVLVLAPLRVARSTWHDEVDKWDHLRNPVMFAHPASAGHGLNLQDGGNILVFFSHWWDLEQYQQIIERIGPTRQIQAGHNRPVWIHHIIAADTVDELVMQRRDSKREVQDILLAALKLKVF